ncbi:MAG: PAS domain S-box protein, partial [Proteobacteria bacterium]|nr:PAS domain S-box protein [Pseudomonadota bacterium]
MSINESIGKAGEIWRQWTQMAQEGFCSIDNDGSILDVNSAMGGFLGLESEDLVGRCIFDFVDESNKHL